jgi:hypothetical protein
MKPNFTTKVVVTNTGTQTIHYVRQFQTSMPSCRALEPGQSIKGHAITYNPSADRIILADDEDKCYFLIEDTITHGFE